MTGTVKISQETYDETLLENQDLFSLSEEEAVTETISQFKQQGVVDLDAYIVTVHPHTTEGRRERNLRANFVGWLDTLDSAVASDGSVSIDGVQLLCEALVGIENYCSGGVIGESLSSSSGGNEDVIAAVETPSSSSPSNKTNDQSVAFLTLFHSSCSMYTLMSFLGIVDVEQPQRLQASTSENIEKEEVLERTISALTSILVPRRPSEREIKSLLRTSFEPAFERILKLISYYHHRLSSSTPTVHGDANVKLLTNLMRLSCAACRNSERNKVSFVRIAKSHALTFVGVGKGGIFLLIQTLITSHAKFIQKNDDTTALISQKEDTNQYLNLMTEICKLVAVLCRFDEFSSVNNNVNSDSSFGMNVSSVHDHVLEFHREGAVPILHQVALLALQLNTIADEQQIQLQDQTKLAAAVLSATRVLAVNDEIVQSLVAVGTLKSVKLALDLGVREVEMYAEKEDNDGEADMNANAERRKGAERIKTQRQNLTAGALGLVRNLCGNDEIKTSLCLGSSANTSSSVLPSILKGMQLYRSNASIQEHGCGTLAAMALRKPSNALRIVEQDGPREILTAMKQFPGNVLVQRQGALAIRNIVSRLVANPSSNDNSSDIHVTTENAPCVTMPLSAEHNNDGMRSDSSSINVRDIFLDLGAEVILRGITGRHQGSVDEAYAALRDLGCKVAMVKYDAESNSTTSGTVMFGDVKPTFRPVYEESGDSQGGNSVSSGIEECISRHLAGGGP